jgi:hypothetical protein
MHHFHGVTHQVESASSFAIGYMGRTSHGGAGVGAVPWRAPVAFGHSPGRY